MPPICILCWFGYWYLAGIIDNVSDPDPHWFGSLGSGSGSSSIAFDKKTIFLLYTECDTQLFIKAFVHTCLVVDMFFKLLLN
jgi:hypothetical protein